MAKMARFGRSCCFIRSPNSGSDCDRYASVDRFGVVAPSRSDQRLIAYRGRRSGCGVGIAYHASAARERRDRCRGHGVTICRLEPDKVPDVPPEA